MSSTLARIEISASGSAGGYPVLIGDGALETGLTETKEIWAGRRIFVVTSPTVRELHGDRLGGLLEDAAGWDFLEVPDGEAAKTPAHAASLWTRMLEGGGKRDSVVLAFGGGAVGDLGGFCAGSFLRGISFLQLPTTLLAQVDASVGGKTGIDLPGGKNTVGLFRQPAAVIADSRWLETLPLRERRAGLYEVVKMAALLDLDLLDLVEEELEALASGDSSRLTEVVAGAVRAKAAIVEADPFESGDRRLLNFGHTLGHALESTAGYGGLRHGEAVGYGMLFAMGLAISRGFEPSEAARLVRLIKAVEPPPLPEVEAEALMAAMARDKKARESGIAWVLPKRLGTGEIASDLEPALVEAELKRFLKDPWRFCDKKRREVS